MPFTLSVKMLAKNMLVSITFVAAAQHDLENHLRGSAEHQPQVARLAARSSGMSATGLHTGMSTDQIFIFTAWSSATSSVEAI